MTINVLNARLSVEVDAAASIIPRPRTALDDTSAPSALSSYWDDAFGMRVHLIDASSAALLGHVGVVMDDTTDPDGLFICISQDLPLERRAAVVRALVIHWAREFDAARAEGGIVLEAVSR